MDPKKRYVYICYYGIDYEGEHIEGVFENKRSAELCLENLGERLAGDYRGIWEWEVN